VTGVFDAEPDEFLPQPTATASAVNPAMSDKTRIDRRMGDLGKRRRSTATGYGSEMIVL
jgi:hypothetical protein